MKYSAGIVLYRRLSGEQLGPDPVIEVLVGHLGGPLWATKHDAAWSFPKGEMESHEAAIDAAAREFTEETGLCLTDVNLDAAIDLGSVTKNGKNIRLFAVEGSAHFDLGGFQPGTFEMQWPPKSGRTQTFPELDRIEWVAPVRADALLTAGQRPFLDRLRAQLQDADRITP
jgi:predicted NUDIX family NTP pyrophosphohydrolase